MTLTLTVFVGAEYFLPKTFLYDYKLFGLVFTTYEIGRAIYLTLTDSDQICRFTWRKKAQKSPNILPCNLTLKINSLDRIP